MHIAVLLWCSSDGHWRISTAFRLWRPKQSCAKHDYWTKLQLAEQMLKEIATQGLTSHYIVFDTHYTAVWFCKKVGRLSLRWVGTLGAKARLVWLCQKLSMAALAEKLPLKWREHLGVRANAMPVYAPKSGELRLVVTRNRHGNYENIVNNDLGTDFD